MVVARTWLSYRRPELVVALAAEGRDETLVLMAESNRWSRLALFAACAMFALLNRLRRIPDIDAPGHRMTN
jgi:hypothetical protein